MKLMSRDGASVDLRPVAYQFDAPPSLKPDLKPGSQDWDANWLVVHGEVTAADGQAWTFTDPCLTTWEARGVTTWLRGVADATVRPTAEWIDESTGAWPADFLWFTEPNLAFSLQERTGSRARIRVHLSLEALPAHLTVPDFYAYFVVVDLSLDALVAATVAWTEACRRFPER